MSILQRIMDSIDPPPIPKPISYTDTWSDETRSKVKQAFSKVKCTANVYTTRRGRIVAIRPKDVDKLYIALKESHLETDSICQGMIAALKDDEEHFVRWTTDGI